MINGHLNCCIFSICRSHFLHRVPFSSVCANEWVFISSAISWNFFPSWCYLLITIICHINQRLKESHFYLMSCLSCFQFLPSLNRGYRLAISLEKSSVNHICWYASLCVLCMRSYFHQQLWQSERLKEWRILFCFCSKHEVWSIGYSAAFFESLQAVLVVGGAFAEHCYNHH